METTNRLKIKRLVLALALLFVTTGILTLFFTHNLPLAFLHQATNLPTPTPTIVTTFNQPQPTPQANSGYTIDLNEYEVYPNHPIKVMITNLEDYLINGYVRVRNENKPGVWSPEWQLNGQVYDHLAGPGDYLIEISPYAQTDSHYQLKYLRVFMAALTQEDQDKGTAKLSYDPQTSLPNIHTHPEWAVNGVFPSLDQGSVLSRSNTTYSANQILGAVNDYREKQNIPPLQSHPDLCTALANIFNVIMKNNTEPKDAFDQYMQVNQAAMHNFQFIKMTSAVNKPSLDQVLNYWLSNDESLSLLNNQEFKWTCIAGNNQLVILLAGY